MTIRKTLSCMLLLMVLLSGCHPQRRSETARSRQDWESNPALIHELNSNRLFTSAPRHAAWAPDDSLLAFLWKHPGNTTGTLLWAYDPVSQRRFALTTPKLLADTLAGDKRKQNNPNRLSVTEFCWRNTDEIIFACKYGFYLLKISSGETRLIHQSEFSGRHIACSGDGQWLSFRQKKLQQVFVVNIDDGMWMQVSTDDDGYRVGYTHNEWFLARGGPVFWSPVGARLLCIQYREEKDQMHRVKTAQFHGAFLQTREHTRLLQGDPPISQYRISVFDMNTPREPWICYQQDDVINSYVYPWKPWSPDGKHLAFQVMEYENAVVRTFIANVDAKQCTEAMKEDFMLQSYGQHLWSADSQSLYFTSEKSGWDQLYRYDLNMAGPAQRVTHGNYVLTQSGPVPQLTKDGRFAYLSSTKDTHPDRPVYRLDLQSGDMTKQSFTKSGWVSSVFLSPHENYLAYVSGNNLDNSDLYIADLKTGNSNRITRSLGKTFKATDWIKPEVFTFKTTDGSTVFGHLYKPPHAIRGKKPLLVITYGGPGRPQVRNLRMSTMAQYFSKQHGFLVAIVDVRGMWGYGREFSQCMHGQAGKPQTEDLRHAVDYLVKHENADRDRCALHGWSFGGFQTLATLCMDPDLFQVGIAGAPVTEWTSYPYDYDILAVGDPAEQSLIPLAGQVTARVLILSGMQDNNVLFQDSLHFYRAMLQAQKETLVELFIDPTGVHHLGGDVSRIQILRKIEDFLMTHLR